MIQQAGTPAPTILVVEDNDTDFELAAWAAQRAQPDCNIYRAATCRALAEYLEPRTLDVDLILVDIRLPDASGIDVVAELRTRPALHRAPIVMFTSSSNPVDQARAKQAGASDYFVKPTDVPEFVQAAEQIVDRWLHPDSASCKDAG